MAETNPKVLAMVERALKKNPDTASTELQERAKKIDKSVGDLTGRQFHARYALRVAKKLAASSPGRKKKRARRKTSARKKGARKRRGGRRGAKRAPAAGPALDMLSETYEQQKAALNEALDTAFQRAVKADSVKQLNDLLRDVSKTAKKYA